MGTPAGIRFRTAAFAALALLGALAPGAQAASSAPQSERVLVLRDHRVHARHELFLGRTELPATGAHARTRTQRSAASAAAAKRAPRGRATRTALDDLLASGQIDQATHDARQAQLRAVLRTYAGLSGTRKALLGAVIDNADTVASSGQLTPSRLAPVFATLDANQQWWTDGPMLANGQRVQLEGSPLVWQYYTGQGIQLQMLANFGKANALWAGKKPKSLRAMMDALVPLAADHGGWPAWEYYFRFGGGKPPWISSISQGTAVQVLGRAGALFSDNNLVGAGEAALAAFEQAPPNGVRADTPDGPFYLIYSFNPGELVINAHLQALVGLYDFGQVSGSPRAQGLFAAGDATAQAVLPSYDTGKWSMYDTHHESDLSYHKLVTTFLQNLCKRTGTAIYCDTATRFKGYLAEPPTVAAAPQRFRAGAPAKLHFTLDKISRVGMTVRDADDQVVFATSAVVGRGDHFYTWPRPAKPGVYELRLTATDLAGNAAEPATATVRVMSARKRKRR